MFDEEFGQLTGHKPSFRPLSLVDEIDPLNDRIYTGFNNGVYKAGFATSQESYNEEVTRIFEVLDEMEEILTTNRYLTGDQVTEADWRFHRPSFDSIRYTSGISNATCVESLTTPISTITWSI